VNQKYAPFILPVLFLMFMSAYSVSAILSPRWAFEHRLGQNKHVDQSEIEILMPQKSRNIASIENKSTIMFDCAKENQTAKVYSQLVYIKFQNCLTRHKIEDYKLVNETNLYMAQFFKPSASLVSTDFIQLARGENILKFEISPNDEQKITKTIKIERLPFEIQ
jgi:hypothetical protein